MSEAHPQVLAVLAAQARAAAGGSAKPSLAEGRARYDAAAPGLAGPPAVVAVTEDRDADGVPVRVYRPSGERPVGVVVFLHGGGFVFGSRDSHDALCCALAHHAAAIVLAVDYRLAPEHPFPAAVEDAQTALDWVVAGGLADHGADPRALAVAGDSAGGTLAAALARRARDRGGPPIALQALIYPVCDTALDTPSYVRFDRGFGLSRADMVAMLDLYLPPGTDRGDPDAAPLRAADLAGVAPAYVLVAAHDVLCDEAVAYAERLRAADVAVTLSRFEGMVHGFARWSATVEDARRAQEEVGRALGQALASAATTRSAARPSP